MDTLISYYIAGRSFSPEQFSFALAKHLPKRKGQMLTILCIGTDQVAGDCLGPLVGYKLSKKHLPGVRILGTLRQPVHGENLAEFCGILPDDQPVIAIDAALGENDHIGWITLAKEPLKPGLGIQKDLPEIGQVSITGIVGNSERDAIRTLMNTRLSLVMDLADCITEGIVKYCCSDIP